MKDDELHELYKDARREAMKKKIWGVRNVEAGLRAVFEAGARAQWIPVGERLPDVDGDYLVVSKPLLEDCGYVYSATFEKPKHTSFNPWSMSGVTHWMPLPAAPLAKVQ